LMGLAVTEPGWTERLTVRVEPQQDQPLPWVQLWVPLMQPGAEPRDRRVLPSDVLFFADELPGGFSEGLPKWFEMWADLHHVLGPVFARARAPFVYANDRFYTAVTALEAYHRHWKDTGQEVPRQAHKARVARLSDVLAREAADLEYWAVNAATPFNRMPLWRRIIEIADRVQPVRDGLFGSNLERFARETERARHGHAHALDTSKSDATIAEGADLYLAASALVWLLRASLMLDLGLDDQLVISRVVSHPQFQWTAEALRDLLEQLADDDDEASTS